MSHTEIITKKLGVRGRMISGSKSLYRQKYPDTCCFIPKEINTLFTKRQNNRGDLPIGVRQNSNKFLCVFTKNSKPFYGGSYSTKEDAFNKYKTEKEKYIKEIAYKWRLFLPDKVLSAMNNYKVEIND